MIAWIKKAFDANLNVTYYTARVGKIEVERAVRHKDNTEKFSIGPYDKSFMKFDSEKGLLKYLTI